MLCKFTNIFPCRPKYIIYRNNNKLSKYRFGLSTTDIASRTYRFVGNSFNLTILFKQYYMAVR